MAVVGYVYKLQDLSVEEQIEMLSKKVNKKLILQEPHAIHVVLKVLPEQLEKGSKLYIVTLSVLGDTVKDMYNAIKACMDKGIEVIALEENISTSLDKEYILWLERLAKLEKRGFVKRPEVDKSEPRKGGRKKIEVTTEMRCALVEYKCGRSSLRELRDKLGCGNTTIYSLLKREEENIKEMLQNELDKSAYKINQMLKEAEED